MTSEQSRLRDNISVLGNSSQEAKLRETYVKKLTDQESRFEKIKEDIAVQEKKIKEITKKIEDKLKSLNL